MPTKSDWVRLGDALTRRRAEMSDDFSSRKVFAEKRNIGYRLVGDIEKARRTNFELTTKVFLERAYDLDPGALDRVLAGGPLVLPESAVQPREPEAGLYDDDPRLKRFVYLWNGMSDDQRSMLMAVAESTSQAPPQARYGT